MLKLFLTIIQILASLYLAGNQIRQNQTLDAAITIIEGGYTKFNKNLGESSVLSLLNKLKLFYAWLSGILFGIVILLIYTTDSSSKWVHYILIIVISTFLMSLLNAVAISWCMDHRKNIKNMLSFATCISAVPILTAIIDIMNPTGPHLMPLLFATFTPLLSFSGLSAETLNHPIAQGISISAFMLK